MRLRLILSFVLVVLVAVAGVVIAARLSTAQAVGGFMYGGGMGNAEDLAASLENYYRQNGSWQEVEAVLAPGGRGQGMGAQGMGAPGMGGPYLGGMMSQRLRLADRAGVVVYDSAGETAGVTLSATERSQAIALKNGLSTVGYLLPEGGMGMNRGDQTRLVRRLSNAALTGGLIAGALALALATLLAGGLLRPVQALQQAAGRLAQGDLSHRVQAQGGDELAQLGQAFNRMADSLQQAESSRQAMTADIAHELRNPLAVQRAHLEALIDGIYPLAPAALEPVLAQNLTLTRLVEDLRTLALADAGQLRLERTPTDLAALARAAVERFTAQAAQRGVTLSLEAPAEPLPPVSADPLRVEQILNNLLSNALRYTLAGGRVQVRVEPAVEAVQVTVKDSGPGIPAEALPHIFERFYRADRSRSREAGGSGLGLAIARQLAEAHGGSLSAGNAAEGGAVFTLRIPVGK